MSHGSQLVYLPHAHKEVAWVARASVIHFEQRYGHNFQQGRSCMRGKGLGKTHTKHNPRLPISRKSYAHYSLWSKSSYPLYPPKSSLLSFKMNQFFLLTRVPFGATRCLVALAFHP